MGKRGITMPSDRKRVTIYFEPEIHSALKIKAAVNSTTISDIVNDAVKVALAEDAEDLAAIEERSGDRLISFEEMVSMLKKDGYLD